VSIALAREAIQCCRRVAACTETPGVTTRTFLAPPMRDVHAQLVAWMDRLGMSTRIDPAGNLRGVYPASTAFPADRRLLIGSHLDTVPNAGPFDGILGVVLGVALCDLLGGERLPFSIEVVGFSDEEGVRYGVPFIGSRALVGAVDQDLLARKDADGTTVGDAILHFGLDPTRLHEARVDASAFAYLEFHIEQGPVLESLGLPLGIVDAIVGQSRLDLVFTGTPGHAGTTPMDQRRDALAGAAEWVVAVEREARGVPGLVATVGRAKAEPGVANVIPGRCRVSLDVRHSNDAIRLAALDRMAASANAIAARRGLEVGCDSRTDQPAVVLDPALVGLLEWSVTKAGFRAHRMGSGAGHDAMILATRMPAAMLFLRSPGGISHHPDENVLEEDVAAALIVARRWLDDVARSRQWSI
jgi:allantoate deiminase